jgi:hypothetical protein
MNMRTLTKVKEDTPYGVKNVMKEVARNVEFKDYMAATEVELKEFLIHDFVARWQGDLYHDMLTGTKGDEMEYGTELWVSDYIENFSTFSALELQQDYYHKCQVAIFIVLVVRHRDEGEEILPSEVFFFSDICILPTPLALAL